MGERHRLTRSGAGVEPVGRWCRAVRVHVHARPLSGFPNHLDAQGYPLHCRWELAGAVEKESGIGEGVERHFAESSSFDVWTDCGSVFLRSGGKLELAGGAGEWDVEVWLTNEEQEGGEWAWLTRYHAARAAVPTWTPKATSFRLLQGFALAGAEVLVAGVEYPIAELGDASGVLVAGKYQVGTFLL